MEEFEIKQCMQVFFEKDTKDCFAICFNSENQKKFYFFKNEKEFLKEIKNLVTFIKTPF